MKYIFSRKKGLLFIVLVFIVFIIMLSCVGSTKNKNISDFFKNIDYLHVENYANNLNINDEKILNEIYESMSKCEIKKIQKYELPLFSTDNLSTLSLQMSDSKVSNAHIYIRYDYPSYDIYFQTDNYYKVLSEECLIKYINQNEKIFTISSRN